TTVEATQWSRSFLRGGDERDLDGIDADGGVEERVDRVVLQVLFGFCGRLDDAHVDECVRQKFDQPNADRATDLAAHLAPSRTKSPNDTGVPSPLSVRWILSPLFAKSAWSCSAVAGGWSVTFSTVLQNDVPVAG